MAVHLLLATVPRRRSMVESLLASLLRQTLVPDRVHLVLDGYGGRPPPSRPSVLTAVEYKMPTTGGPGGRWRVLKEVPEDAALVVLDDDQCLDGDDVVERLVRVVEGGAAASYMGMTADGCGGVLGMGTSLVSIAAGVSAYRAGDLAGLDETAAEIRERCGFDPFGVMGDDDAVVSAHLWRRGVSMRAAGPLAVSEAPGGQEGSQFVERQEAARRVGHSMFWQREAIARVTGWPWPRVGR